MKEALFLHAYSCFMMTGLIWIVQIVHYPSFAFVDRQLFGNFAPFHARRITWIVGPIMLLEIVTGAYLFQLTEGADVFTLNLILLSLIWICTAAFSVRYHGILQTRWDEDVLRRLIWSNWPRTLLWTTRSIIVGYLLFTFSP